MKKIFLGIFQNLQENTYDGIYILIKIKALILKRNCEKDAFLWVLPNFYEQVFYRTPPDKCSTYSKN